MIKIFPATAVIGDLDLPGDKSISHRSIMLASIADGVSTISNFLASADCLATIDCFRALGVEIERAGTSVIVTGRGRNSLIAPSNELDCGNSGTTARLICGILAAQDFDSVITGDDSLKARPMDRVIEPLRKMGGILDAQQGRLPITIRGRRLTGTVYELEVASAQVKSCILLAGLFADGETTVIEPAPTRDHTERMIRWLGGSIKIEDRGAGSVISLDGDKVELTARDIAVPSDISSAAFFVVAAACLPGSCLNLPNVGVNPRRAGILSLCQSLGVDIRLVNEREDSGEPVADIVVRGGLPATSDVAKIDGAIIPNVIDELPVLAVLGTQLKGGLEVRGARELRVKETDRIAAVVSGLRKMGADVEEFEDGFRVSPSRLKGAEIETFGDHRIAMAFAVAGLIADGETEIQDPDCVAVSFPQFFDLLKSVVR